MLFIFPDSLKYSFIKDGFKIGGDNGVRIMGFGDAAIPAILVASVCSFVGIGAPLYGVIIGTFLGGIVLACVMMLGKPLPGLPFLNIGAVLGYFIGTIV
jgi:presenilin-like A22 family membrane protease